MKALAIFTDKGCHWASRFLRPGFRHVAAAVLAGDYWVGVDPVKGTPDIRVIAGSGFDLANHYRDQGFTVVETEVAESETVWPLALANCVGAVKAVLGVRAFAVTPWSLYRHLSKEQA